MSQRNLILAGSFGFLLVAIGAAVVLKRSKSQANPSSPVAVAAPRTVDAGAGPAACQVPKTLSLKGHAGAEDPPVLLWGGGGVRLYVDGQAAFSPPEKPRRFAVGEHTLKVEAEGHVPLQTRFRLDPHTPALFHATVHPDVGITLVRIGVFCTSCAKAVSGVNLGYEPAGISTPDAFLTEAASAMRGDDWKTAALALRSVAPPHRKGALYKRLASATLTAAAERTQSREVLTGIPHKDAEGLDSLLRRLGDLEKAEEARKAEVVLSRWNKVTERFSNVVMKFEPTVPGRVAPATQRLQSLSLAFEAASKMSDVAEQEVVLSAAELTLLKLVEDIRGARPDDCSFQSDVVATVMR